MQINLISKFVINLMTFTRRLSSTHISPLIKNIINVNAKAAHGTQFLISELVLGVQKFSFCIQVTNETVTKLLNNLRTKYVT
jgi:hypothetical protein